jgi:chemotaxis receptor (MCP) glutamine deamidase CheD
MNRSIVHDIDAGSCAVAVGAVDLRAPHVGSGLVLCVGDGVDVGGMAHVLASAELPAFGVHRPGFFVGSALPGLLQLLRGAGARRELRAVLVGAAAALHSSADTCAGRTLEAARLLCQKHHVPIVDELTGGAHVREVVLDGYGTLTVTTCRQMTSVSLRGALTRMKSWSPQPAQPAVIT